MKEEECLFTALLYWVAEYIYFASLRRCLLPTFFSLPCHALFFVVHYNHISGFSFFRSLVGSPLFICLYVTN